MQGTLFDDTGLPPGAIFVPDFLSAAEELALLAAVQALPLEAATYKGYTARRRVATFAPDIPPAFEPLRARLAAWLGVAPGRFEHLLVAQYAPGTPLGWHRDAPMYESIVGVSLQGHARMRLRPWEAAGPRRAADSIVLDLPPRSAYVIEGPARWGWQHAISETRALRWSLTWRTPKGAPLLQPP